MFNENTCCMCDGELEDVKNATICSICKKIICSNCRNESRVITSEGTALECELCEICYKHLTPESPEWSKPTEIRLNL